jgi:hypothetical protein
VLFFRTVPPANTLVRWVNENAFAFIVQARPCPTLGRPVHRRGSPHRLRPGTSPHTLQIPSHDGHPVLRSTAGSGCRSTLAVSGFRLRARLGFSIPIPFSGQRGITPAFGYSAPHPGAGGTSTLMNNALLSAHYGSVRLPVFVHHRLLSLDFPMRPARAGRSRANPGSPNFRSRCVPACQGHRPRRTPVRLAIAHDRMLPSASCQGVGVLKFGVFRGSITWPAVPPVNASYMALQPCPHDSEPVWFAGPSPYGSSIHYTWPARCLRHRVGASTRHPQRVAAELPRGNSAGT